MIIEQKNHLNKNSKAKARCKTAIFAGALAMLWLSCPAESQETMPARANAARSDATPLEAEQVREVIRRVIESVDSRRWESLTDGFAESVYVDYTSLFGGYPRSYMADDLA